MFTKKSFFMLILFSGLAWGTWNCNGTEELGSLELNEQNGKSDGIDEVPSCESLGGHCVMLTVPTEDDPYELIAANCNTKGAVASDNSSPGVQIEAMSCIRAKRCDAIKGMTACASQADCKWIAPAISIMGPKGVLMPGDSSKMGSCTFKSCDQIVSERTCNIAPKCQWALIASQENSDDKKLGCAHYCSKIIEGLCHPFYTENQCTWDSNANLCSSTGVATPVWDKYFSKSRTYNHEIYNQEQCTEARKRMPWVNCKQWITFSGGGFARIFFTDIPNMVTYEINNQTITLTATKLEGKELEQPYNITFELSPDGKTLTGPNGAKAVWTLDESL